MKHLFITGVFRSGTSLLSTALNVHPDVLVGWQPFWLFFKECRNKFFKDIMGAPIDPEYPMGVLQFRSEDESKLFKDVLDQVQFSNSELASVIYKIKTYLLDKSEKINSNMKPAALSKHIDDLESGSAGYVLKQLLARLYLTETRDARGKRHKDQIRVVGIKEVFCEEFIEPILYPDSLESVVLHVIRDPRGVVASRNYGRYYEATGSKYPIYFIVRSWQRSLANYHLNRENDNYLMIKYEDLVSNPEEFFWKCCKMLDIKFSRDMIDVSKYRDGVGNAWEPNSSFGKLTDLTTAPIDSWQSVLSEAEVEIVEYFCQSEMRNLEYEVTTDAFEVERILDYQEEQRELSRYLRKYDFKPGAPIGPPVW